MTNDRRRLVTVGVGIALVIPTLSVAAALSPLGRSWADRLHKELEAEHPGRTTAVCDDIANRFGLGKITEVDNRILGDACSQARAGKWSAARSLLDRDANVKPTRRPTDTPPGGSVLAVGDTIRVRNLAIPVPKGARILGQKRGSERLSDDRWLMKLSASRQTVLDFYSTHLVRVGWKKDGLLPNCWTKPRAGSKTDEIVCLRFDTKDLRSEGADFEVRVSP